MSISLSIDQLLTDTDAIKTPQTGANLLAGLKKQLPESPLFRPRPAGIIEKNLKQSRSLTALLQVR
jgi:hypothetical protein